MFLLKRVCSNVDGTFGVLITNQKIFCMTLEPQVTKLPIGFYKCVRYMSPKRGYEVYKIDFPQADGLPLEIHIGNTVDDTSGCILVGSFDPSWRYDGKTGVNNSKMAFDLLMGLELPEFILKVEE